MAGNNPNAKGLLGGLLGARNDGPELQQHQGAAEQPAGKEAADDAVVAYEDNWYRSLKAFAESQFEDDESDEQEPAGEEAEEPEAPQAEAPSLSAADPALRRAALEDLSARALTDDEVPQVAALLTDPDREVRRLAAQTLVSVADEVDEETVRRGLQDIDDEVRAATVRLAAARGTDDLDALVPPVSDRGFPAAQRAALKAIAEVIERGEELEDDRLSALLFAVAGLETPPRGEERDGLSRIARALGEIQLVGSVGILDDRRLGAVRMLVGDQSPTVLRALAARRDDAILEIRKIADDAAAALAFMSPEEQAAPTEPEGAIEADAADAVDGGEGTSETGSEELEEPPTEDETGIETATTEEDVEEATVDEQAAAEEEQAAVEEMEPATDEVEEPERPESGESSGGTSAPATEVAELLGLTEVAGDILAGGPSRSSTTQGTFLRAVGSLQMSPGTVAELLDRADDETKPEAVRLLWRAHGRAALDPLRPQLASLLDTVRVAVLEVFAESGDPEVMEEAHNAAETDPSPAVRAAAIGVIAHARPDRRLAVLAHAVSDEDADVRAAAMAVLPAGIAEEARDSLIRGLQDPDDRVQLAAMRHLAALPNADLPALWEALRTCDPGQREPLIDLVATERPTKLERLCLDHAQDLDAEERALAVHLGGRAGTEACGAIVSEALADPSPSVRRAAASALGALRAPAAARQLGNALSDPDPEVRIEVVRALGVIDHESVLGFLLAALQDPQGRVRDVASEVLTQWSSPAVARRLAEVLTVPDRQPTAAKLLRKMGRSATELMIDVILHGSPEIVPVVGELLESIVGVRALKERIVSKDPEQRFRAVVAMGAIGGGEAVEALARALEDPNERVRMRALMAIDAIGDDRAFQAVKHCFESDPVPEVVSLAEEVLGRLEAGANREVPAQ